MRATRFFALAGFQWFARWSLSLCAVIGFAVVGPGSMDLTLVCAAAPMAPTEEDENAPMSEGAVVIEAAHARREPGQPRRDRQPARWPHAHTPNAGFENSDFRPPPDHFRNGLGTPLRC